VIARCQPGIAARFLYDIYYSLIVRCDNYALYGTGHQSPFPGMKYQRFTANVKQKLPGQARRGESRWDHRYHIFLGIFAVLLHGILEYSHFNR
jgi:hypothetical protein